MKKESTSFLKKRSKKLLLIWGMGAMPPAPQAQRKNSLFGSFSSEKELLAFAELCL